MRIINIVAKKGGGKTTTVKNKILPKLKKYLVFDLYGDDGYSDLPIAKKNALPPKKARIAGGTFQSFMAYGSKLKDTALIVEDATIFIKGDIHNDDLRASIIGCRHRNILLVFLWHSLGRIPPFILEQSDFIILGNTQDGNFKKYERHPQIEEAHNRIKARLSKGEQYPFEQVTI